MSRTHEPAWTPQPVIDLGELITPSFTYGTALVGTRGTSVTTGSSSSIILRGLFWENITDEDMEKRRSGVDTVGVRMELWDEAKQNRKKAACVTVLALCQVFFFFPLGPKPGC